MYARLGNNKPIPAKTRLCGIVAYYIQKMSSVKKPWRGTYISTCHN